MMKKLAFLCCLVSTLALLPAIAQVQADSQAASGNAVMGPRRNSLPRSMRPHEETYDFSRHVTVSYNTGWAGYAVTGSDFTRVEGSWIVHAVNCTKTPNTFSSEWVGIDGWSSDTVEQIGTDADCIGKTPFYWVWYEFYPYGSVVIRDVSIAAGDEFAAAVNYDGDNNYTVTIKNKTTGQSFSKKVNFDGGDGSGPPQRNSAEWIMEMDGNKLSDFGVDPFGKKYTDYINDRATDSSVHNGVIDAFGSDVQESITTQNGQQNSPLTALPSDLASDGASFTVTWKSE
jgi:hypothetical protein